MEIRQYKPIDKERLRFICKETAFDSHKKNAKLLESVPIMFCDYFTECEPEYIFVIADENDEAQGYIICSTNYSKFVKEMKTTYLKRVLKVAPSQVFYIMFFLASLKKIKDKPIHFHIDMLPHCQKQGYGTKLIELLIEKLKYDGFDHLSICCTNRNSASYKLCMKLGFKEIYVYHKDMVSISKSLNNI